ncbi:putative achaete-scute-like protein 4-like [Triplophysa rosa]|uniref:Achaete-scute-like protein 4-like n=1 Tax=Triplophysa rosa TaxID=992332 RepID=A0A9W7WJK9_TRIRA|nr:putative achaete-scute-like protein 4-like [Triplophysa rosa]
MGSDHCNAGRVSNTHPLAFSLSLNHQYPLNHQEPVCGQRYIRCFSYLYSHYGVHDYSFEPAFIHKRNERERQRVRCVNDGYARLREHLPREFEEKRLSKVETLRAAISYIKHLQNLLEVSLPEEMCRLSSEH